MKRIKFINKGTNAMYSVKICLRMSLHVIFYHDFEISINLTIISTR